MDYSEFFGLKFFIWFRPFFCFLSGGNAQAPHNIGGSAVVSGIPLVTLPRKWLAVPGDSFAFFLPPTDAKQQALKGFLF